MTSPRPVSRTPTARTYPPVIGFSRLSGGAVPGDKGSEDSSGPSGGRKSEAAIDARKQDSDNSEGHNDKARRKPARNRVCFDITTDLHLNDCSECFQSLTIKGALRVKASKNQDRNTNLHVRFTKLYFDVTRTASEVAYEQSFLNIAVNSRALRVSTNITKPLQSTGTNPQAFYGVAFCGLDIDDPSHRKGGIKLPDAILPTIDFLFYDDPTFPDPVLAPSIIDVEINSKWSLIPCSDQGSPWISRLLAAAEGKTLSPYSNFCQELILTIPVPLTNSPDYQGQLCLDLGALDLGHTANIQIEDRPVESDMSFVQDAGTNPVATREI